MPAAASSSFDSWEILVFLSALEPYACGSVGVYHAALHCDNGFNTLAEDDT